MLDLTDEATRSWFKGQTSRPVYALIIGINNYLNLPKLRGAVNDADALSEYLKTDLQVPQENIIDIRDEYATRAEIQQALRALSRRHRKEASIVMYFAGYGSANPSIPGIQTIIPVDYSDNSANPIPPVTADELLSYVNEIKRKKGDSITLIFDCGGITVPDARDEEAITAFRGIPSTPEGDSITGPTGEKKKPNVFVLSAASDGEAVKESHGRGLFTTQLIKTLRREGAANLKRSTILSHLPTIAGQTPCATGSLTDTPLFETGFTPPEQVAYAVSLENDRYIVHVGSAAGITHGTQFYVYRDQSKLSKRKAPRTFVADQISLFYTSLKPLDDRPLKPLLNSPGAVIAKAGVRPDLVVHVPLKNQLAPLYEVMLKLLYNATPESYHFFFTEDSSKADISLDVSEDGVLSVKVLDERAAPHGFVKIPAEVPLKVDDIERFLISAANFYRQLNQSIANPETAKNITLSLVELISSPLDYDENGRPLKLPAGGELLVGGIADIQVDAWDDHVTLGYEITNNTAQDVYLHAFYFDHTELSIDKIYPPPGEQTPIAKNGGTLRLGWGNGLDDIQYRFEIPEGQDIDIGFVKLMFSAAPVDLTSVVQRTVYRPPEEADGKQKMAEEMKMPSLLPPQDPDLEEVIGTSLYLLVQHRVPH